LLELAFSSMLTVYRTWQDAIFVQELVSNLDGYPLGKVFGRWQTAPYAYTGNV
jgi:hypothetical protein